MRMMATTSTHVPISGEGVEDNQHASVEPSAPPALTDTPKAYAGCCLALSRPLVTFIHSLLPQAPALTLSIGSGFGLLEAHLLALQQPPRLMGVEVDPSPNLYLPAANHRVVYGTRFLEPLAAEAAMWLFVYPRRAGLISEYLDSYGKHKVQQIIWIGPQADWDDYSGCFSGWDVRLQSADEVGGRTWDMVAILESPGVTQ
jgi:hypothetical protein